MTPHPLDDRQSARKSKTQRALTLFGYGLPIEEVASITGLSRRYAEGLKRSIDRQALDASYTGEFAYRTQRHADAVIAQGGFESLSERCVGYDNTGNRRMVACLPIISFGG